MPEFFDYDPLTGVRYDFDYDEETGEAHIHSTADVESLLDYTKAVRNDGLKDHGIKESWWLYAKIPPIVMMKMRAEKGIEVGNPAHTKRIIEEINTHYPHLKVTQKNHGGKLVIVHDLGKH